MQKYILTIGIYLYFTSMSCSVFAQDQQSPVFSAEENPPAYLFVESAGSAKISKSEKLGHYFITLNNAEPWVVYFSDRPHRDMGFMTLDDFMHHMKNQEKKYEPKGLNAALISVGKKDDTHTIKYVFTLHDMKYNSNTSTVTYQADVVPQQNGNLPTIIPPESFIKHVALFIDACVGCTPPP